jgi:hypothetical protein
MIGKLIKGRGARGLCAYLLGARDHNGGRRPRAEVIGGTLSGQTARDLAAEFGTLHRLRPRLGVHMVHMSLRIPADERPLADDEWRAIGQCWAEGMGFDAYTIVSHGDHIHVAASRVRVDGSVVSDAQDWRRSEEVVRVLEREHGLRQVEASHLLEPARATTHRKAPGQAEIALAERGMAPTVEQLRDLVEAALADRPTVSEFVARLEAAGVDVRPNVAGTGKLSGFAYALDGGAAVTAAVLGRGYTLSNMLKRGLSYDPDRDIAALHRGSARAAPGAAGGADAEPAADVGSRGDGHPGPGVGAPAQHRDPGPPAPAAGPVDGRLERGGAAHADHDRRADGGGRQALRRGLADGDGGGAGGSRQRPADLRPAGRPTRPPVRHDGREAAPAVPLAARLGDDGGHRGGGGVAGLAGAAAVGAQAYKARLWSSIYDHALPADVADVLRFVDADRRIVRLADGARVEDHGDRITTDRTTPAAARLVIAEAKAKGWTAVRLTGGNDFRALAWLEAQRQGVPVVGWDPPAAVRAAWEAEQAAQTRSTPQEHAMADTPPNPAARRLAALSGRPVAAPDRTLDQIRRQLAAFGADAFEVQPMPPKGSSLPVERIRRWTADQVQQPKTVAWLKRMNAQGYDIFVRPVASADGMAPPFAFVDDLDSDQVARMAADGLPFAVQVESSPGRFHGWVRLADAPLDREEVTAAARVLADRYGGDPASTDWRHYGRLAGFTNQKPSRKLPSGHQPWAMLHAASGAIAPAAEDILAQAREALMWAERAKRQVSENRVPLPTSDHHQSGDAVHIAASVRTRTGGTDQSASGRDFAAALSLLRRGFSEEEVRAALLEASPDLVQRGHRNPDSYVARTVAKAAEIVAATPGRDAPRPKYGPKP